MESRKMVPKNLFAEASNRLCINLEGCDWEGSSRGGDICIPMADSC